MRTALLGFALLIVGLWISLHRPSWRADHVVGLRLLHEGRHEQALATLAQAVTEAGDSAPAGMLFDLAVAALAASELRAAEIAAERAAARGGRELLALRDFVFGSVALVRSDRAGAEALLPEADPTAFERALDAAARARHHWQSAVVRRGDWPEARRNAERAARTLEDLEAMRREAEAARERRTERTPRQRQEPEREIVEQEFAMQSNPNAPPADLVERVLATLRQKELEKRELRGARRAERTAAAAGRDW